MSKWQGMFLRVKHAWTCLLRVLATWDFHATVAKGKGEDLEPSQQTGFQQPGFWITMVGFRIPLAGFRIPKRGFRIPQSKITWIPDSGLPYMGRYYSLIYPYMPYAIVAWSRTSKTNLHKIQTKQNHVIRLIFFATLSGKRPIVHYLYLISWKC